VTRFINQESRKITETERQNRLVALYRYNVVFITNFQSYRFTTITAFKGILHLAIPVYTPDHEVTWYDEEARIAAQSLVPNLRNFPDLETLDIYTQNIRSPFTSLSKSRRSKRIKRRLVSKYGNGFKRSRKGELASPRLIDQAMEGGTNRMDPTNISKKEFNLFRLASMEKGRIQAYLPRLEIRIMRWESENLS
jgi:hypothetical protein